jgi:hypothetical protein
MADPSIKYGILRTRDLVELYYGARMVTDLVENYFPSVVNPIVILQQDPRRIRYEVIISYTTGPNPGAVVLGSPRTNAVGIGQTYWLNPGETIIVERDFLTDLDAVTIELDNLGGTPGIVISTRETFLTPTPVDEGP